MHAISHRVARFLEKRGFLERDAENSYLALEPDDDDAMVQLQEHSITYRIAVRPQQGRKVFTLQTLPPDDDSPCGSDRVTKEAGFSLHAGVSTDAHQRDKLERLCRYATRPAISLVSEAVRAGLERVLLQYAVPVYKSHMGNRALRTLN